MKMTTNSTTIIRTGRYKNYRRAADGSLIYLGEVAYTYTEKSGDRPCGNEKSGEKSGDPSRGRKADAGVARPRENGDLGIDRRALAWRDEADRRRRDLDCELFEDLVDAACETEETEA